MWRGQNPGEDLEKGRQYGGGGQRWLQAFFKSCSPVLADFCVPNLALCPESGSFSSRFPPLILLPHCSSSFLTVF